MVGDVLTVAMNGLEVGHWRKLSSGATKFRYSSSWL